MNRFFLLIPIIFVFACKPEVNNVAPPDGLIPLDKMIEVMADVNLIEAQIAEVQLLQSVVKDSVHAYYGQLFYKYGISRDQLDESIEYYSTQTELMDSIGHATLHRLEAMEKDLEHVEVTDDVLTHIKSADMTQLLADTNLTGMLNRDISYALKYDSLLRYFRANSNLLDSIGANYRQFGVSLNFYVGSESKFDKVMDDVDRLKAN